MRATSSAQFLASQDGTIPRLEKVRGGVWAMGSFMPGGHIPYSLLYLVRDSDGGVHVIDPGWDSDRNWEALVRALGDIDASVGDIRSITATHLHPDHIDMAERMRIETGAPVQVHSAERDALDRAGAGGWPPSALAQEFDRWKVPGDRRAELEQMAAGAPARPTIHIDRVIEDGERLDIPGFELVAMLTPGHTVGSLSLRDEANGLMFTGDVLLPTLHAGLGLGGLTDANPLRDYLESLRALRKYPDYQILPGHGYRFTGLVDRSEQSAEHHLKRAREVAAVLSSDPGTSTWDVARRLSWTAGWEQLAGFYLYSALSQTDMHRDFVVQGGLAGEPIVRTP